MRLAYELAFCNASVFIKYRPLFLALDEISFRKPVPIGTFLALDSQIVFAEGGDHHSFQVMVKADMLDIQAGTTRPPTRSGSRSRIPRRVHQGHATDVCGVYAVLGGQASSVGGKQDGAIEPEELGLVK